jgi:hypothetical protein
VNTISAVQFKDTQDMIRIEHVVVDIHVMIVRSHSLTICSEYDLARGFRIQCELKLITLGVIPNTACYVTVNDSSICYNILALMEKDLLNTEKSFHLPITMTIFTKSCMQAHNILLAVV